MHGFASIVSVCRAEEKNDLIMDTALLPIIVTVGISTLIVVVSVLGTFVVLLNHLSARIEQSEQRMNERTNLSEQRMTERINLSEQRMTHRMDRSDDKLEHFRDETREQFQDIRQELLQRPSEHPVAGDD